MPTAKHNSLTKVPRLSRRTFGRDQSADGAFLCRMQRIPAPSLCHNGTDMAKLVVEFLMSFSCIGLSYLLGPLTRSSSTPESNKFQCLYSDAAMCAAPRCSVHAQTCIGSLRMRYHPVNLYTQWLSSVLALDLYFVAPVTAAGEASG
jgi:hypothetical protein